MHGSGPVPGPAARHGAGGCAGEPGDLCRRCRNLFYRLLDDRREGNVTAYTGEGTPTDNYIHYDAGDNTLTLHNATIKKGLDYNESIQGGTYIHGSAIGVFNQNGDAELTIQLQGQKNTLSETATGIYVYSSSGTASLTITGSGSLTASGSSNGIRVVSTSNAATLNIKTAKVTATSAYDNGVMVQAGSANNDKHTATLEVNGGSLVASGNTGIEFNAGSYTNAITTTLIVSDSALVDTRNGGINVFGNNSNTGDVSTTGFGIVFDGNEGIVYGDVTLQEDLTISDSESLILDNGASLSAGGHNVIVDGGMLDENIKTSLADSVKYTPTITTTSLSNGIVGRPYSFTLKATGSDSITWSLEEASNLPNGLSLSNDGVISGTPTSQGTSEFTVEASNKYGSDSKVFMLMIYAAPIIPVSGISLDKDSVILKEKESDILTATVKPDNATNKNVTWESSNPNVVTVDASGNVTAKKAGKATITVKTEDGNFEATCEVTVMHGNMTYTAANVPTCTADGNTEYWTCDICGKHFKDADGNIETTIENTIISKIGHSLTHTKAQAATCTQAGHTEYWTCDTCGKHFKDAEGKEDISLTDTIIFANGHKLTKTEAKAPTCVENGHKEYWTCESCGQYFSDVNGTTEIQLEDTVVTALGHSYKEVKWNWMDDGNCTATLICTNDKSHSITSKAVVSSIAKVPATCTNMGVTQYKATVVFDDQTYTNTKEVTNRNMLAHHYSDGRCVMCGTEDPNYQEITKPIDDNIQSDDKDSQKTTTVNKDIIKSVKTGDMTYLAGWLFLLSVSAFVGAIVFYKKKKTE